MGRPSISKQLKQLADILSIFDVLVAHLLPKSVCRIKTFEPHPFALRAAGPIFRVSERHRDLVVPHKKTLYPTFKAFANILARFFPICRLPFSISEI